MTDPLRNALRLRLGAQLRVIRRRARLSGRQIGERTGISQSKVSRIETGELWPPIGDVAAWLDACYVDQAERERVLALAEAIEHGVTTLRDLHRGSLEVRQLEVADLDAAAVAVRDFQPAMVPALFQTPDYARACITAANLRGERDVEAAVAARMSRVQRMRAAGAPAYHAVVMEAALRWRPAGAPDGLPAVWASILDTRDTPTITLQVIPDGTPTAAPPTCGYTLHHFADDQPLVIVETPAAELTFAGVEETGDFATVWERMAAAALPAAASLDLVADLARTAA